MSQERQAETIDGFLISLVKVIVGIALAIGTSWGLYYAPGFVNTLVITDTKAETAKHSDPSQRHRNAKLIMLDLTNQHRAAANAPPVTLGRNPASQLHAEAALAGCYSSHWDRWGLKPNHRYTLTGGTGNDGENASGNDICVGWNYMPIWFLNDKVADTVQRWMDSPGHRRNLLNPAHTVLNVGIAHDRRNVVMMQHFSSDYVQYFNPPIIDREGTLRLQATVRAASLQAGDTANITISYDPPPKPLTAAQLSDTYSLCLSKPVAWITEPLAPGWSYNEPDLSNQDFNTGCVDPYHSTTYSEPAETVEEAHQRWERARAKSSTPSSKSVPVRRIIARTMSMDEHHIHVSADMSKVLDPHGPGIYTVTIWGKPDHMIEPTPLSSQAIFWRTAPPVGSPYSEWASPSATSRQEAQARTTATKTPHMPKATGTKIPPTLTIPNRPSRNAVLPTLQPVTLVPPPVRTASPAPTIASLAPTKIPPTPVVSMQPSTNAALPTLPPMTMVPPPTRTPAPVPTIASFPPTRVPPITNSPTQAPTPTPIPTPTADPAEDPEPSLELFDNSAWREYTILYPQGAVVKPGLDLTTISLPDGPLVMTIGRHLVQHDSSIGEFADDYRQEFFKLAPAWDHFNETSARGVIIPAGNAVVSTFERRKNADSCTEDGITQLIRSRFFPKRSTGYSITVTICRKDLPTWAPIRQQMLDSFTENPPGS